MKKFCFWMWAHMKFTDKQIVFLLLVCLIAGLAAPGTALAAGGDLVPTFGTGGTVTIDPSGGGDAPFAIAIDSTYMYVVGYDSIPGDLEWRIEKRRLDRKSV